jgi:aryl-alcohol dehydrogenase-like predicted oxidoreductase
MTEHGIRNYRGRISLGVGTIQFGRPWGDMSKESLPTDEVVTQFIQSAVAMGITFFDTAPAYGLSEKRLGAARTELGRMFVATKFGEYWDAITNDSRTDHSLIHDVGSLANSLHLLGSVDLLQVHKCSPDVLARLDVQEFLRLVHEFDVALGASIGVPASVDSVISLGVFDSVQFPLNSGDTRFLECLDSIKSAKLLPIVNRPFSMGSIGSTHLDRCRAFEFIGNQFDEGIILTGTMNPDHLSENMRAFQSVFH